MSLKMNDKSLSITIPNADIRIDYYTVNPGTPFEKRKKSTFEKNEETGEENEILGEVTSTEKRYNVNLFLQYQNQEKEGVYHREVVSINGLKEEELTFKVFYTKMKELEKFSGAQDA